MPNYELIAALGSSFASGPGIPPIVDVAAGRSGRNYPNQLAERIGARLVDLTVSGATTSTILDTPQETMAGIVFPPQIDGVPENADLITLTAGGNDLQFAGSMIATAFRRAAPDSPMLDMLGPLASPGIPAPDAAAIDSAASGLVRIVEEARRRAPSARIVLVDYLTVLDAGSSRATPFTEEDLAQLIAIQDAIEHAFADAAARTDADLVLASRWSTDHALGSTDPWVQPFHPDPANVAGSFHPNEAGMSAIAAELERRIA